MRTQVSHVASPPSMTCSWLTSDSTVSTAMVQQRGGGERDSAQSRPNACRGVAHEFAEAGASSSVIRTHNDAEPADCQPNLTGDMCVKRHECIFADMPRPAALIGDVRCVRSVRGESHSDPTARRLGRPRPQPGAAPAVIRTRPSPRWRYGVATRAFHMCPRRWPTHRPAIGGLMTRRVARPAGRAGPLTVCPSRGLFAARSKCGIRTLARLSCGGISQRRSR
jgi:hypothetical protein